MTRREPGDARRRNHSTVLYDILHSVIAQESSGDGKARITRVQNECNLPTDRVREYVDELRTLGLLERDELSPTMRGKRFVSEYQSALRTLRRYGLG